MQQLHQLTHAFLPSVRVLAASTAVLAILSHTAPEAAAMPGGPNEYELEILDIPPGLFPPFGLAPLALDMNNRGQVVGQGGGLFGVNNFDAFLYEDGQITEVQFPGAFATDASGINDQGGIFGSYAFGNPAMGAPTFGYYLDATGNFIDINPPGAVSTRVFGGNNRGDAVGIFFDGMFPFPQSFMRSKQGVYTTITPPADSLILIAIGINDHGVISGESIDFTFTTHDFLLEDGVFTTIDVPFDDVCSTGGAGRTNNRGDLTGSYALCPETGGIGLGYVRTRGGVFQDVSFPVPSTFTQMSAISDRGDLLGVAFFADGSTQCFVWHRD